MPLSSNKGESKNDFVSRCVSEMLDKHPIMDNDQAVAACDSMWGQKAALPCGNPKRFSPNSVSTAQTSASISYVSTITMEADTRYWNSLGWIKIVRTGQANLEVELLESDWRG